MRYNGECTTLTTFVAASGKVIHFLRRRARHTAGSVYHSDDGKNFWPLANLRTTERRGGAFSPSYIPDNESVSYVYPAQHTEGTYQRKGDVITFDNEQYVGQAEYRIWQAKFHELPKSREIRLFLISPYDGKYFFVTQTKYRPEWACMGYRDWRFYMEEDNKPGRELDITWGEENTLLDTTTIFSEAVGNLYVLPWWERNDPDSKSQAVLFTGQDRKIPLIMKNVAHCEICVETEEEIFLWPLRSTG